MNNRSVAVPHRPTGLSGERAHSNPQLRILGNILRMHIIWVLLLGAALAATSIALILRFWEPEYEAKAYLRVVQNPGYFQVIPEKFQVQTNAKDELAPIRSELLLNRVLADDDVRGLPSLVMAKSKVKQLAEMISYRSVGGPELFEVVCRSTSPKEAASLVSSVTDTFLDFVRQNRDTRLQEIGKEVADEVKLKRDEIKALNTTLSGLASQRQGGGDNAVYDPDGEYLTELQKTKSDLVVRVRALQAELELLPSPAGAPGTNGDTADGGDAGTSPPVAATPIDPDELEYRVETHEEVLQLKNNRGNLLLQRSDQISRGKGENHPEIKSIDLALKKIERDLRETRLYVRRSIETQMTMSLAGPGNQGAIVVGPDNQLLSVRAIQLHSQIAGLQRQMEYYEEEINKQRDRITRNNEDRWNFESKQVELARAMTELDRLLDAESTLHFRKLSLPYQITRESEEKVTDPEAPIEEYPLKLLGIALAASFGIPLGLAFLWETRAKRISEPDQLVQNLPCGVVGEVAMVPLHRLGAKNTNARLSHDKQIYQESVDKISTLLALTAEAGNQVIAITSAVSHEGKSTFASQLAISLARATNQEILLIDADLRSPVQHRLFETSNMVGLVDAINDHEAWETTVNETKVRNLYILPAGRAPSKPTSCFVNNSWEQLLEKAQARFGIIVVDTPPVLSTSESVAICRATDRTLLCVLRDVSRTDAVHRAHSQLTAAHVNVLGCVFGGIKQSAYTYRYGGEYQASEQ